MKLIHALTMIAAASLMSGCLMTDGLKKVNAGLANVNNSLSGSSTAGTKSGPQKRADSIPYQDGKRAKDVTINVPEGLCEPERYVHAWKQDYANTWNDRVRTTSIGYSSNQVANAELSAMYLRPPDPIPARTPEEIKQLGLLKPEYRCNYSEESSGRTHGKTAAFNDSITAIAAFKSKHQTAN